MKPNGKKFAVCAVLFAVCAVSLLSGIAGAETVHGTFKLPVAAQWGRMWLSPGEYEFTVDTESPSRMLFLRSETTSFAGMVMCSSEDEMPSTGGSRLALGNSDAGAYVETLYLGDAGVALRFEMPKAMAKLAKAAPPRTMVSSSGTH